MSTVRAREFDRGDLVVTEARLRNVAPGTQGQVTNVIYNGDELKFLAVKWESGQTMGLKFTWTLDHIKLVKKRCVKTTDWRVYELLTKEVDKPGDEPQAYRQIFIEYEGREIAVVVPATAKVEVI